MQYYSTKNPQNTATLEEAVLKGLADDNGLYMPAHIPVLPRAFMNNLSSMTLQDMSFAVANYATQGDLDSQVLHDVINETLNFDIPLHHVAGNRFTLELYHGPTMSFKDIGARFMGRMFAHYTQNRAGCINVLVATSGNSGGAVANGFFGIPGVRVYVLYPQDTLSNLQEAQFTTLGGNITAIEVNGSLEDCQEMVLEALTDKALNEQMTLTSAKTINIARLLPQMFYYFWAYAKLAERHEQHQPSVVFSVPCGNLGNLTAGIIAKKMGLPIKRLIASDNKNDIFTHYLKTGEFIARKAAPSIAPAMDIGHPRNFERIGQLLPNHKALREQVQGVAYSDQEIADTILTTWKQENYLLDPQGATAYQGLIDCLQPGEAGIALATAHPAKFIETIERIIGTDIPVPAPMFRFLNGIRHVTSMSNGYRALRNFLITQQNPKKKFHV